MEEVNHYLDHAQILFKKIINLTKEYVLENPKANNAPVTTSVSIMYLTQIFDANLNADERHKFIKDKETAIDEFKALVCTALETLKTDSVFKG